MERDCCSASVGDEEEGMRAKRCFVSAATICWSSGKVTLREERRCQESCGDGGGCERAVGWVGEERERLDCERGRKRGR